MKAVLLLATLASPAFILNYEPHWPFRIDEDADFTVLGFPNLLFGVRSGDGSTESPYAISRWLVTPSSASAWYPCGVWVCLVSAGAPNIALADTRLHVLLLHNRLEGVPPVMESSVTYSGLWRSVNGIVLDHAENVTVDFMYLRSFIEPIRIVESKNIVLRHLNLSDGANGTWIALYVKSSQLLIEQSVFEGNTHGIVLRDSRIVVRDSTFSGNFICGVCIDASSVADLRYNWWGSPDGPNSPGADKVYGPANTLLEPWLVHPPPTAGYVSELISVG